MTTSARMLSLLSLLQARRDWPGALLAERLEVSPRTVRRDVGRLREFGYRITAVKGPDGGYRLDAGSELPPLLFDDEQAVALAIALQLAASSGADIVDAAARALATVRQVLPSRLRHRVDAVSVTSLAPSPTVDPSALLAVTAAVRVSEVLRFDYRDARRRVEPHHVVHTGGRWYLVAWDLDRGDWRMFRLDRLSPVVPTGPRFTPRELDVASFVSARFKNSPSGDAWACVGSVVLALPASSVAPFAGDGVVEDLGDGRCRLAQGSWSWVALAAAFARFDAGVSGVEPAELRDAFAVLAERFASVE